MMNLYKAFSKIKTEKQFNAFMADLMTPQELRIMNARWRIAQLLWNTHRERVKLIPDGGNRKRVAKSSIGLSQEDIQKQTGVAKNTITKVSICLFENKNNGYRSVLQ
ncbi:MAG: trp operon repressor [Alphaproteobacteria bacterium]|nr:trp operon repressor [Alphaproteobacteria bacterium]